MHELQVTGPAHGSSQAVLTLRTPFYYSIRCCIYAVSFLLSTAHPPLFSSSITTLTCAVKQVCLAPWVWLHISQIMVENKVLASACGLLFVPSSLESLAGGLFADRQRGRATAVQCWASKRLKWPGMMSAPAPLLAAVQHGTTSGRKAAAESVALAISKTVRPGSCAS